MKYLILREYTQMASCILGHGIITENLLAVLKKEQHSFLLYQIEEEAPIGPFAVKLMDNRVLLQNNSTYGIDIIPTETKHVLVFEPDSAYDSFGTGYCREYSFNAIASDEENFKSSAIILLCDEEGPASWTLSILDKEKSTLDINKIISVKILD